MTLITPNYQLITNFLILQDKHLLSRLLLLLNPNYAPGSTSGNRNRRPLRRKKPKINVIEGSTSVTIMDDLADHENNQDLDHDQNIHSLS
jgi:hypothetical protein